MAPETDRGRNETTYRVRTELFQTQADKHFAAFVAAALLVVVGVAVLTGSVPSPV